MTNLSWLKLDVNILNDSKIKIIRTYPEGNSLVVFWIGLLCLAMRSNRPGIIELADGMAYTDDELANEIGLDVKTVQMGLAAFEKLQMVERFDDSILSVMNFMKHQELDKIEAGRERNRQKVAQWRKKQLLLKGNSPVTVTVTESNRIDKNRIDKKRIDKSKDEPKPDDPVVENETTEPIYKYSENVFMTGREFNKLVDYLRSCGVTDAGVRVMFDKYDNWITEQKAQNPKNKKLEKRSAYLNLRGWVMEWYFAKGVKIPVSEKYKNTVIERVAE